MLWFKKVTPRDKYLMKKVIRKWNNFMKCRKKTYEMTCGTLCLNNLISHYASEEYLQMKDKYTKSIFERPKNYVIL